MLIGGVAPWRHSVGWRCPSPGWCPRRLASSRWSDAFGCGLRSPLTIRGLHPSACPRHSTACPHSAPKAVFGRALHHQDYLSASAYRCPINQVRDNQHSAGLSHGSSLCSCALLRSPPLRDSLLIGGVAAWRCIVGWCVATPIHHAPPLRSKSGVWSCFAPPRLFIG